MEIININKNESRTIVRHIKTGGTSDVTFNISAGATLKYIEISHTKSSATTNTIFNCERDSSLLVNTLDVDNQSFERQQTFNLNAENVSVDVVGLYISGQGEFVSNKLHMNHFQPHCTSKQLYRGIIDHHSLFNGHIYIAKDAQQTVALQENHNVLLNDNAKAETRPWLEIYADDVKCNHGATVGKNDPEAIYYMRQRGIPADEAKKLLLEGFVMECITESDEQQIITTMIADKIKTL